MERTDTYPLPARDPITGGEFVVTELESPETGITIRGRFEVPRFARLNTDQARYLETFLRCRGMLNSVEKELGISYPTARARLDAVLRTLDLNGNTRDDIPKGTEEAVSPTGDEALYVAPSTYDERSWESAYDSSETIKIPLAEDLTVELEYEANEPALSRSEILTLLEQGDITPEEAKRKLGATK